MFKKVISFKNSEENLFRHLDKQFCPSAYIKELIKRDMENKKSGADHNSFNNKFNF